MSSVCRRCKYICFLRNLQRSSITILQKHLNISFARVFLGILSDFGCRLKAQKDCCCFTSFCGFMCTFKESKTSLSGDGVQKGKHERRKTFRFVLSTRRKVSPDLFASELESFWQNALFQWFWRKQQKSCFHPLNEKSHKLTQMRSFSFRVPKSIFCDNVRSLPTCLTLRCGRIGWPSEIIP